MDIQLMHGDCLELMAAAAGTTAAADWEDYAAALSADYVAERRAQTDKLRELLS